MNATRWGDLIIRHRASIRHLLARDGVDGRALIPAVTFLTVAVGESDGRPALVVKKNVHLRSRAKAYSILSGIVMAKFRIVWSICIMVSFVAFMFKIGPIYGGDSRAGGVENVLSVGLGSRIKPRPISKNNTSLPRMPRGSP